MSNARKLADLLDSAGDVKSAHLDNVPASDNASSLTTGTIPIARIADDAITNAKMADDAIDSAQIASGAVDDDHLATGISSSKLTGALPAISGASLTSLPSQTANDFTNTLKTKLDGVATSANLYVHPNHSGDVVSAADGAQTIAADAVTYAKMQNVSATDRILGRDSSGAGIVEEIAPTALRTMINVEDGATADQTQSEINALGITATGLSGTPNVTVGTVSSGNITTSGYIRGPSSFTIDPATHGDDTGTVVVAGNLQVDGTTTTINSTTVAIDDLNFSIATDAADSAAANGAGITIGGAGATLNYTHATTSWDMNKPLNVTGNIGVSGTVDGVDIATRDAILTSTTTTAGAALPKAGGTMTGSLDFGDNVKAQFGASDDLQIYHDGSHSYIKDAGTGNLRLMGTELSLRSESTNEPYINCTENGSVRLYHDNSVKLETTSTGVDVTGALDFGNFKLGDQTLDGNTQIFRNYAGSTEYMTIDNSGNVLVGATANEGVGWSTQPSGRAVSNGASATFTNISFQIAGSQKGWISTNSSATSYNTSSDYRLKENVVPLTGSIDRLKELKPSKFNFITDVDKTVDGFLAHEVSDTVPEAISGEKDAMRTEDITDEEGNVTGTQEVPDMQGIDQSKLVPLLVSALQEAITRIETLENA